MQRLRSPFVCAAAASLLAFQGQASAATAAPKSVEQTATLAPLARTSTAMRRAVNAELGQRVEVRLPLAHGDQTLELVRFSPLTAGARVIGIDANGDEQEIDLSGLTLFKGAIKGDPDSLAFVSVIGDRINGFVRSDEGMRVISTGNANAETPISYELARDLNLGNGSPFCSVDEVRPGFDAGFHPGYTRADEVATGPESTSQSRGTPPCRVARVAIDSDYEFTQRFGGNITNSAAYAVTLLAASSSVYERDLNVRLAVPFVRVYRFNNDPYVGSSSTNDFLDEMRDHWNAVMRHIPRETVHGLSGRSLGGGVAYVNALCSGEYAHGISANMNGSFPMPVQDNNGGNWDLMVVSHELGHNFGTGHTHDQNSYNPVIDGCGNGDCALATDATIMSYCHLCAGGLANMDMRFHPRVQSRILNFLDAVSCDLTTSGAPQPRNDFFELYEGQAASLDVLSNDEMASCAPAPLTILAHPAASVAGGVLTTITGMPATGQQIFYSAPAGYSGVDSFTYTTSAGIASVSLNVAPVRAAETGPTEPGVNAAYYSIPSVSNIPNFGGMTPFFEEIIPMINFASTSEDFAGSGLADNVGAVFETLIEVPESGLYQLSIESDDGSRLWLGDDLVIDNNGLHGMRDASAYVALGAGKHPVRVEFFEAGGGAGLIMRYAGASIARQSVPASALSRSVAGACPADLAEPFGSLNFFDVSAFIAAYNAQDAAADLAAPFGAWNFFDVSAYIGLYNAGCP